MQGYPPTPQSYHRAPGPQIRRLSRTWCYLGRKRMYGLTTDHRIPGQVAVGFALLFQLVVDIGMQGHVAQVKLDFEILGFQGHQAFGGDERT